jgi:hypothetical protein
MFTLHGYARDRVEELGLLDLREVTLFATAEDLRRVANFLLTAADRIDDGKLPTRHAHLHIDAVIPAWKTIAPYSDVVVMNAGADADSSTIE